MLDRPASEFIKSHGEIDASQNGESRAVTSNLRLSNEYKQVHSLENKVNKMLEAINENVQKAEKAHKQKTEKEDDKPEDVDKRKG